MYGPKRIQWNFSFKYQILFKSLEKWSIPDWNLWMCFEHEYLKSYYTIKNKSTAFSVVFKKNMLKNIKYIKIQFNSYHSICLETLKIYRKMF